MVMPDELNFYADCPDLKSKVKRLQSVLRYPGDVRLMDDVLEFIDVGLTLAQHMENTVNASHPPKSDEAKRHRTPGAKT